MHPTPKGGNLGVQNVKLMYFFKVFFSIHAWYRQTKCIVMMNKKR